MPLTLAGDGAGSSFFAHSTDVILVAVAGAFILAGLLLTFYLMPRSKSEPGQTIVPDEHATRSRRKMIEGTRRW